MDGLCPIPTKLQVVRLTRIDGCGRPVYGPGNQVVTKVVSMSVSPEVEEGDPTQVQLSDGTYCVNEPGKDSLSYNTVEFVLCSAAPDLMAMINSSNTKRLDERGRVVGLEFGSDLTGDGGGYALEGWTGVAGAKALCGGGGGSRSAGTWYYMLFPRVSGGRLGDLEFSGDDSATFTITGKTKADSGWGIGPYLVTLSADKKASPLFQPVGRNSHMIHEVVFLPPPKPFCGTEEVPRPIPTEADLMVCGKASDGTRRTISYTVDNHGFGPVVIDPGDGEDPFEAPELEELEYTYDRDDTYTMTVQDQQDPGAWTVERVISIPLPSDEPTLEVTDASTNTRPNQVSAVVGMPAHSSGRATVDFGDGTEEQETTVATDGYEGHGEVFHNYEFEGRYRITVTNADCPDARVSQAVSIPLGSVQRISPPTRVRAEVLSGTEAEVMWSWQKGSGADVGEFETDYRVQGEQVWEPGPSVPAGVREVQLMGLEEETTYEVQVTALAREDPSVRGASRIRQFTTVPGS